jgi:hypothetical protein
LIAEAIILAITYESKVFLAPRPQPCAGQLSNDRMAAGRARPALAKPRPAPKQGSEMDTLLAGIALFALALLLGGMVFFAAVVAPRAFRALPPEMAGRFVRHLFPAYYLYLLGCSAAAAVALFPLAKPAAGIMAAVAGLGLWLRQVLMPRINAASDAAKAGRAEAEPVFHRLHRLSVIANLLQMAAAGAVLALFAAG